MAADDVPDRHDQIRIDELRQIKGIGRGYAQSLLEAEIDGLSGLASYSSPAQLHAYLAERGVEISVPKIQNEGTRYEAAGDWIAQARQLLADWGGPAEADHEEIEVGEADEGGGVKAEAGGGSRAQAVTAEPASRDRKGFTVFFERESGADASATADWATHVLPHDETGKALEGKPFGSADPSFWATWMIECAGLLDDVVGRGTSRRGRFEITEFTVRRSEERSTDNDDQLEVVVRVRLTAAGTEWLVDDDIELHGLVVSVGTDRPVGRLLGLRGRFDSENDGFPEASIAPVPEVGDYHLACFVFSLEPFPDVAVVGGPVLRVRERRGASSA